MKILSQTESLQVILIKEIGPEGYKLLYTFIGISLIFGIYYFTRWFRKYKGYTRYKVIRKKVKVEIELTKNRIYFPEYLTLTIRNTGTADADIERPLMVFNNFWMKRKFRIKGHDNYHFYPLYLEAGKTHTLRIDLEKFYKHDRALKRFPRVQVFISTVKGKKLGKKSIMLRKTLLM